MFYLVLGAWLGGVAVSFFNGNRKFPLVILLLGVGLFIATLTGRIGGFGIAGMALLAAIIWIANKADMG